MSALDRIVRAGVKRRRVQTVVTFLAVAMAVTATVLGASLLVASSAPFDHAFSAQNGSQLTAQFDASKATAEELAASADADGVAAAAGPYPTITVSPSAGASTDAPPGTPPGGFEFSPMTLVARPEPDGGIDDIALLSGTWATQPGQIVITEDLPLAIGKTLVLADLPNSPALTIVGIARSVSESADGWIAPAAIADLSLPETSPGYEMLYRFDHAGTAAEMTANRAAVAATVPSGALIGSRSWLDVKQSVDRNIGVFVPFLVTFGILGIVMSILIVGGIVSGAVGVGLRRIGILKALGFTPAQIVRAYIAQALVPAAVATLVGVVAGNALTVPVLSATEQVYGTSTSAISGWIDVGVAAGMLALVVVVAWAASARAGRLRTVDALATGRAAGDGRGRRSARVAGRLRMPRAVTLGVVRPFARPGRAVSMVLAIAFGTAAVTFALGLGTSLTRVEAAKDHGTDVTVIAFGAPGGRGPVRVPAPGSEAPPAADPAAIAAAIRAQPGTESYFARASTDVAVAGVTGSTSVQAFSGDDASASYALVAGRWFAAANEIVVPSTFVATTGAGVGDYVTFVDHGTSIRALIVGEVFDPHEDDMEALTDASTLAAAEPDLQPTEFSIRLKPGTDRSAYAAALSDAVQSLGGFVPDEHRGGSDVILAINTLTAILTLMLVAVAALGVLNALVLDTRERVHDIGIHRALGMTPRQTIAMVLTSVVGVGVVGGAIGVPIGAALHAVVLPAMGRSGGVTLPGFVLNVYHPLELIAFGAGGLVIAIVGALLPSGWAARTRIVTALRTE